MPTWPRDHHPRIKKERNKQTNKTLSHLCILMPCPACRPCSSAIAPPACSRGIAKPRSFAEVPAGPPRPPTRMQKLKQRIYIEREREPSKNLNQHLGLGKSASRTCELSNERQLRINTISPNFSPSEAGEGSKTKLIGIKKKLFEEIILKIS